jgi:MerR family transcriptional regulator/heat shock protein HspR
MPREHNQSKTHLTEVTLNGSDWQDVMKLLFETDDHSSKRDVQRPVYYISVVAEMVEIHPQTLRMYERMGLVTPRRTPNNIRLYSDADVQRVRRIQHLTQGLGVNLAGVELIFNLLGEMEKMHEELHGNEH